MTWADGLVFLILACSALLAAMRGFVREALGLCAWVGAAAAAWTLFGAAAPLVRRVIQNVELADPVAFGLLFLGALIVLSILASLIARAVRASALGGLDRTIGLLFGTVRGALLVSAAYIAGGWLFSVAQWPDAVLSARSLPYAYEGARRIVAELPAGYAPRLEPPPELGATPSGALLQSRPRGFALQRRAAPTGDGEGR